MGNASLGWNPRRSRSTILGEGRAWDPSGNTSRILMTGLRCPGQRGATAWDANWVRPIIPNRLMMLLSGTDNCRIGQRGATAWDANWVRPITPNRLMMLLSGTDNRRSHLDEYSVRPRITPSEVQELQCRAREYTRQQLDQMDRAFHREWISLISRNALAFPYPMGEPEERESEARTLMATPIRGYADGSAASTVTPRQGFRIYGRWKELWRMNR